jgi:hypothetical protein
MLYLDLKPIKAEELAAKFGLTLPKNGTDTVSFEQLPSVTKIDPKNPGIVKYRRRSLQKDFTSTDKEGNTVRITQSKSALVKDVKTQEMISKDSPRHFEFHNQQVQLGWPADKETIVTLLLNPENIESPLHKGSGKKPLYRLQNLERDANISLAKELDYAKCLEKITTLDEKELVVKAAGFGVHNASKMGVDQLKSSLIGMAKNDPTDFYQRWTTQSTGFRGTLNVALEKGIIVIIDNNGYKRVTLKIDGVDKEVAIIDKSYIGTEKDFIYETFTNRFDELYVPVSKAVSGVKASDINEKMDKMKDNETSDRDKVEKMFAYRVLKLVDGEEDGIYVQNGIAKDEKAYFRVQNEDKYISETLDFFEQTVNKKTFSFLWMQTANKMKKAA